MPREFPLRAGRSFNSLRLARLLLGALLAFPAVARGSIQRLGGPEVPGWVETEFAAPPSGYAPLWVEVENKGSRPRAVTAEFRAYSAGRVSRTVTVEPGERVVVHLPVPGRLGSGEVHLSPEGLSTSRISTLTQVATEGTSIVLGTPQQLETFAGKDPERGGRRRNVSHFGVRHMPDVLASYLGRRVVLLLDASAARLSRPQRLALEQFVLAGGSVVFAGEAAAGQPSLDTWDATERSFNSDELVPLGFGSVQVCPGPCATALDAPDWRPPHVRPRPFSRSWDGAFAEETAGYDTLHDERLMPGIGQPPVGAFLLIILLFALAIGPGNVLVARRWGRHVVLVTIPALAFVTCTGIATYGIAADGLFTVHAAARSVTILDPAQPRATTLSVQAVYAALAPGRLEYPAGTGALFGPGEDSDVRIDWTRGPTYAGEFLGARSLREIALVSVQPARARIARDGNELLNALGGPILRGFARLDGKLVSLGPAPDGAPIAVGPEAVDPSELLYPLRGRVSRRALERAGAPLEDGEYLVAMSESPFVPGGGLDPERHPSHHVVRGSLVR